MKKSIVKTIIFAASLTGVSAQTVNIPDANFKAFLLGQAAINTNSDSEIQVSEAMNFNGSIAISNLGIADLTGIEAFPNITALTCDFNNLTSLDVSANTSLVSLICNNNSIASLNTTGCTLITSIAASSNSITSVDLSTNTALQIVNLGINSLTSLDLTSNVNLTDIYCFNNNLSSLNVANGNNTNITTGFVATGNPNLSCIQVDDVTYSTTNWTNIDPGASFSLNCCVVNIPDANFKAYLVGNTSINTNSDTEIQCSEATAFTGTINCQNMNIADLTGIEAFTSLTTLLCGNNPLGTIDVSQNTALIMFQPHSNNLTSLDVSQNTALTNLVCPYNNLTSLDVSQNTDLALLSLSYNSLTSLDLSQNVNLGVLSCGKNNLTSLDVSACVNMYLLSCDTNDLSSLNMKNLDTNTLTNVFATGNPNLSCIEVDDVSAAQIKWTNIDLTASFNTNCNTTSLDVNNQNSTIKLFPNPSSSSITINGVNGKQLLEVYNVSGKKMREIMVSENETINIEFLSRGVYFIKLENSLPVRLVKQ